jgi:hypothetical protein
MGILGGQNAAISLMLDHVKFNKKVESRQPASFTFSTSIEGSLHEGLLPTLP